MRAGALLLAIGCNAEAAYFTAPPAPDKATSVVFAVESEDEVKLEARAILSGAIPPVTIEFDRLGRSEVWALYYQEELAAHGLSEGTIRVLAEGSALDPPDRIHRAEFLGGELGDWSIESEMSARMRELAVERAPPPDPCARFGEERTFPLATRSDGAFALRVDGERALIATQDARLYLVTIDGITPLGTAVPLHLETGLLAENGDLIVGAAGGRTFRGPFEPALALVQIARNTTRDAFRWMDGGGEELFAVTSSGALEHFDGAAWTTLVPADGIDDWKRGVAWIAPGEAVAVGLSSPIVRAIGGRLESEPVDATDPFTSVAHVPGLGTFAGTLVGAILRNEGDRWEPLLEHPFDLAATAIAGFGGGIVVSGGTGQTAVWEPEDGFCERISVNSPIVKHVAVLDRVVVFLGDARDNETDPTSVSVVAIR